MAAGDLIKALRGISGTLFSLGLTSTINLKNNSGVFEARDSTDAAYIIGRGAAPVGPNDWVIFSVLGAAIRTIEISVAAADGVTQSTAQIPAGARDCKADASAPFTGGTPTLTVGNTAEGAGAFMGSGDNDPAVANLYAVEQYTLNTLADVVDVTVAGTPTGGGPILVYVAYADPDA
jgi:hypothetical protein